MKILILCYVSEREDIQTLSDPLDFHDFASLASLIVQPVAVLNRRSVVQESTYETTAEVHKRYRNLSKKKSKKSSRNNSKYTVIKRKRESERVTIDTRAKSRSKTNAVWDELRKESSGETSEEKTEHTNSATIGEENSSVQTYLSRLAKIPFIGKYFVEHRQK